MMSYGDQRPKSFQGEKFAKIMSHANISKVKLSLIVANISFFEVFDQSYLLVL